MIINYREASVSLLRGIMKIETIKVYKGSKDVIINKYELINWQKDGWETSSDRQKKQKQKSKATKKESE